MIEDIDTPQPFLRVYPPEEDVFAAPAERLARHLRPLVSIDLSAVNPDWQGWIHLVNPFEPADGMVGQFTQDHHNDYLRENWVAFRLDSDDRYELMGDLRYFQLENPADVLPEPYEGQRKRLEDHCAEELASLVEARERFARLGVLYTSNRYACTPRDFTREAPCNLIDQLGGGVGYGNWSNGFPLDDSDPDDVRPLSPDGKRFHFIAAVTGWDYCATGADWILLFYEPDSRVALITFDWT